MELRNELVLSDDLTGDVDLVGHIGNIEAQVVYEVGKVDLFVWVQAEPGETEPT